MAEETTMIEYTSGDILKDESEALVNTVNCVGVMGRGIALQFKKAWPENFKAYAEACQRQEVQPGRMFVFATGRLTPPRWIINFPTKRHWRGQSQIEDIEAGLTSLVELLRSRGIHSVALPPLGSGLGGLDWHVVRARIEAAFSETSELHVRVYTPVGAPVSDRMAHGRKPPSMTAGRAILIAMMHRYLKGLLDPTITLLEVHKLLYFMQVAGEPLRLRYVKSFHGPYAENLRHVLHAIEGHWISGYVDGGDAPGKELTLMPGAVEEATAFLSSLTATCARFERVASLIDGFESPSGLELLSTIHWVMTLDGPPRDKEDLIERIHAWGASKRRFSQRQIDIALDVLRNEEWIEPIPTVAEA